MMNGLIDLLQKVADSENPGFLVKEFQNLIWNNNYELKSDEVIARLHELAYDLDFYEPDPAIRGTDCSFYGEDRLYDEIKSFLEFLQNVQHP